MRKFHCQNCTDRSQLLARDGLEEDEVVAKQYVLRIAGINHKDPAMRHRLIELLNEYFAKYKTPDFIAVEWDENVFSAVLAKREELRGLLKGEWPNIPEKLLNTLVQSLGYEGDAHLDVYPNVDTVWLDQGRKDYGSDFTEKFAKWRLRDYRRFLGTCCIDSPHALSRLSESASKVDCPRYDPRDRIFADAIRKRSILGGNDWAIAIVGDDHARTGGGSMRDLLAAMGYKCEVCSLMKPQEKYARNSASLASTARRALGGKRVCQADLDQRSRE